MPAIIKDNDKWIVRETHKGKDVEYIFDNYKEAQNKANELTFEKLQELQNKK